MSIIEKAKAELAAVNFGEEDSRAMIEILEKFFNQWDSGGAVYYAAPVLQKLIAGKPLSPLTGADEEWWQPISDGHYQNLRCSSIFKATKDGPAYDIDIPGRPIITFPHWPGEAMPPPPNMVVETN